MRAIGLAAILFTVRADADPPKYLLEVRPADKAMSAPDFKATDITPDRSASIALIEEAVKRSLKDPDSAKFEWPNGFTDGWYRIPFGKKITGWITCGTVNAKNSYGGYVGRSAVVAAVQGGAVVGFSIDPPDSDIVASICRKVGVPVG